MEQEAQTTRNMLSRIPDSTFSWKPHEKSMTIKQLATHIAEIPGWVSLVLNTSELDFASNHVEPADVTTTAGVLEAFDKSLAEGKAQLEKATEADLLPNWTMRNGEQIYSVNTKAEVIRMSFCQTVHHRAQLGVYLRLLDVAIPGSYGPSADEMQL